MALEKVPCQIETYKQTTKSGSASSSSGGRSRLSSVNNDNLFLENGKKSPSLGDDSNDFEQKKAWQMQIQKNVLGQEYHEINGLILRALAIMDPESEKYEFEQKLQKLKLFIHLDKSTEK